MIGGVDLSKDKDNKKNYIEESGVRYENENVKKQMDSVFENYAFNFAKAYNKGMTSIMNPYYTNDFMKDFLPNNKKPNPSELKKWISNPRNYEDEMRMFSQYLEDSIQLYKRAMNYFASMLTFNYILIPPAFIPTNSRNISDYKSIYNKCLIFLEKLRLKYQASKITRRIMGSDAAFYFWREDENHVDLQELPPDYCYITGNTSSGYSFSFDMMYFFERGYTSDNFPTDLYGYDMKEWYSNFLKDYAKLKNKDTSQPVYIEIPRSKGICIKWNDIDAGIVPPLSGVFKDALQIEDYKDLLRAKTELDTWKIIFQEIPKKDGIPTIDAGTAGQFIAMTQKRMPQGTKTMAAPMKPHVIDFESASTQNSIIGKGEQVFFQSSGVNANLFGDPKANSAGVIKYSITGDYGFIKHILYQFENAINDKLMQFSLKSFPYSFKIKFVENDTIYNNEKNQEISLKNAQFGGFTSMWMATQGLEPHQVRALKILEEMEGLKDLEVLKSSHTENSKSNDGGRPRKDETDLKESGELTRQHE